VDNEISDVVVHGAVSVKAFEYTTSGRRPTMDSLFCNEIYSGWCYSFYKTVVTGTIHLVEASLKSYHLIHLVH
jgi:hypothetical protein